MDKTTVIENLKIFADSVKKYFPVKSIILYGSFAKGTPHKDSDIDVAVVLDKIEGDYLDSASKLYRLRRDIDTRIEPLLIDRENDKSGFLEEIIKTGEIIYSAE